MNDKVVKFKNRKDVNREDMTAMIEELLQMVKDGEVRSVACIAILSDDTVSVSCSRSDCHHHLVAGTVYLQNELVHGFD